MPLDDDAVAAIYREHGPMLQRLALRATGDPQRAQEIVQEVVMRVWRQAPEPQHLRAYLAQATRNLVVDQHRAAQRRPQPAPPSSVDPDGPSAGSAAYDPSEIDRALDALLVEQALRRLSPEHLAVVRALHYRRLTVTEAAAELGLPPGTVKSRAFYAVRHLRAVFDEMGVTR